MSDGLKDDGNGKTVFIQSLISSLIGVWLTAVWSTMLDESTNVSIASWQMNPLLFHWWYWWMLYRRWKNIKLMVFAWGGYSVVYLTDRFYFFKFIFSWLFLGYIRSLNNLQQIFGCINSFKVLVCEFYLDLDGRTTLIR